MAVVRLLKEAHCRQPDCHAASKRTSATYSVIPRWFKDRQFGSMQDGVQTHDGSNAYLIIEHTIPDRVFGDPRPIPFRDP